MKNQSLRRGLILLVVLGMLALFSMLAITYVVFSRQSRSASFGIARRDYHGMMPSQVIDEAMKQVLRGTSDNRSAVGPHSLLADYYGHNESFRSTANLPNLLYQVRSTTGFDQAEIFAGRFLRIPLLTSAFTPIGSSSTITSAIPTEHNALSGRVVTFLEGPLRNISFRIVRSVGRITSGPPEDVDARNSIIIDLQEAAESTVTVGTTTRTLGQWLASIDSGSLTPSTLCVGSSRGFQMWINARELNGLGYGMPPNFDGSSVTETLVPGARSASPAVAVNLQPGWQYIGANDRSTSLTGDSDESYDAPDFNDFWLAYSHKYSITGAGAVTENTATYSSDIIPSFHRAALINYLVNRYELTDTGAFTHVHFVELLGDIERACGRPLAISVTGLPPGTPSTYTSANPFFEGSNPGDFPNAVPTLSINLGGDWEANWLSGSPSPYAEFIAWLRLLTGGPWDVDNTGDGVNDSVWVDLDLPIITGPDGKLLKMLAAYYIEDLDSRLDMNAVGNLRQSTAATYTATTGTTTDYALSNTDIPQGAGWGPAEASLRHLFGSDSDYSDFLHARYGGTSALPGESSVDDLRSRLTAGGSVTLGGTVRNTGTASIRREFRHDQLPGLPLSPFGEFGSTLDRWGNPLLVRGSTALTDPFTDDPYESRLSGIAHQDLPFSISDWERVYRSSDWDSATLSTRLGRAASALATPDTINLVTPRSSHSRIVPLATTSSDSGSITSLYDLLESVIAFRGDTLSRDAFEELFPMEFGRGMAMNLNRPLGNGIDDDMDGMIDEPEEISKRFNGIDDDRDGRVDEVDERNEFAVYVNGTTVERSDVVEQHAYRLQNGGNNGFTTGELDLEFEALFRDSISGSATAGASRAIVARHSGQQSRQLMARHLYCLAMLILPDPLYMSNRFDGSGDPVPLNGADRARVLAQWAVNVVDFRDADHVMTRFAYDPDPFTPVGGVYWLPNSDGSVDPSTATPPMIAAASQGNVVWGMEQPELLLTESGAFHDLRVRDTAEDTSGNSTTDPTDPDDDFDQYRLPQGSLFLEFFCPRTTAVNTTNNVPGVASATTTSTGDGLYVTDSANNVKLNLSALSPFDGTSRYPVWRVALSEPHTEPSTNTPHEIYSLAAGGSIDRNRISYQLESDSGISARNGLRYDSTGSIAAPAIDRILWFTNIDTPGINLPAAAVGLPSSAAGNERSRVYGNLGTDDLSIFGGQYLVVGPRQVTNFGSKTSAATSHTNQPSNHRIVLEGPTASSGSVPAPYTSWANVYLNTNTAPVARRTASMRDVVPMVAVTDTPSTWAADPMLPDVVGLNVSEPHPTAASYYQIPAEPINSTDTTGDPTNGALGFADLPHDSYYDFGTMTGTLPDQPFDAITDTPIERFYQPLHPPGGSSGVAAPGTQLDWCTAFLQRLADPELPWHAAFNPYITVDWMPIDLTVFSGEEDTLNSGGVFRFGFRQKNGAILNDISRRGSTFLSYATDEPRNSSPVTGTGSNFTHELPVDTEAVTVTRPTSTSTSFSTLGYLNSAFGLLNDPMPTVSLSNVYRGAPSITPASLYWANREFANPHELMLVPLSAPGQLMQEFHVPTPGSLATDDHYAQNDKANAFRHLPNFFQELPGSESLPTLRHAISPAAIFELVSTPSPWVDGKRIIPPTRLEYTDSGDATDRRMQVSLAGLFPPYNYVENVVEHGRVNLNTVNDARVWQGLEWNYRASSERAGASTSNAWNSLVIRRNGYAVGGFDEQIASPSDAVIAYNPHLNGNYPTQFPGVFKSAFAAGRVPNTRGRVLDTNAAINPTLATLMRQGVTSARPFLEPRSELTAIGSNAFEEYLPLTRMSNLTTTRSNVFAVRLTVGYFEFDPVTGLGQEYGWDNGTTRRHRGFYVIDRSIPVAFEPGRDNNTEDCILLRRIVE